MTHFKGNKTMQKLVTTAAILCLLQSCNSVQQVEERIPKVSVAELNSNSKNFLQKRVIVDGNIFAAHSLTSDFLQIDLFDTTKFGPSGSNLDRDCIRLLSSGLTLKDSVQLVRVEGIVVLQELPRAWPVSCRSRVGIKVERTKRISSDELESLTY